MVLPAILGRELIAELLGQVAGELFSEGGAAPSGAPNLHVEVHGVDRALARLAGMEQKLAEFPIDMLNETQAWETEDVRRRNPQAQQTLDGVEVVFRTHVSGFERKRSYAVRRSRLLARRAFYFSQTPKPVLRQQLVDRLLSKVQSVDQRMRLGNAVSAFANCGRAAAHVRGSYVPTPD